MASEGETHETAQRETEQPETEQPETEQPETEQPETEQSETVQPETEQPETVQPETEQSETEQPEPAQSETAQSETDQPETDQPETDQPEHEPGRYWCHQCQSAFQFLGGSELLCPECEEGFVELAVENTAEDIRSELEITRGNSPGLSITLRNADGTSSTIRATRQPDEAMGVGTDESLESFQGLFLVLAQLLHSRGMEGGGLETALLSRLLQGAADQPGTVPASADAVDGLERPCISAEDAENELECPVCMDQFAVDTEALRMPCKHTFHPGCLKPWLELHNSCPVCRHELPTDDPNYERTREERREEERRASEERRNSSSQQPPVVEQDPQRLERRPPSNNPLWSRLWRGRR